MLTLTMSRKKGDEKMANLQIKLMARGHNIPQWKIAEYLGISEITLSRMLRKELTPEKKEQIKKIIKELSKKEKENNESRETSI